MIDSARGEGREGVRGLVPGEVCFFLLVLVGGIWVKKVVEVVVDSLWMDSCLEVKS